MLEGAVWGYSFTSFNAKLRHVTHKVCNYRLSELTVLRFIQMADINALCDGKNYFSLEALTLNLLTWTKWWAPASASKWRMGFNSAFKGLKSDLFMVMFCSEAWIRGDLM